MDPTENEITAQNIDDGSLIDWINSNRNPDQGLAVAQKTPGFERVYVHDISGVTEIGVIGDTVVRDEDGWFGVRPQ